MNWTYLIIVSLIAIGGFIASSYEPLARKQFLPVGRSFQKSNSGLMFIIGGFVSVIAIIGTAFLNPWWTIFIVLLIGWLFSQLLISFFKSFSQILSIILIFPSAFYLIYILMQ